MAQTQFLAQFVLGIAVSGSLCFKVAGYFAHDRRLRLTVVLPVQYRYHDVRNTNEIARRSYLTRWMQTSDVVLVAVGESCILILHKVDVSRN